MAPFVFAGRASLFVFSLHALEGFQPTEPAVCWKSCFLYPFLYSEYTEFKGKLQIGQLDEG